MNYTIIGWDTETGLVAPGRVAPPLVCLSYQSDKKKGLVKQAKAVKLYRQWLLDDSVILVGHNIAFDNAVMWQHDPSLRELIWAKYDKGLMLCTMVYAKLHFIATREGFSGGNSFKLSDATKHFLGIDVEGKKGEDVWRLKYHQLINVAIDHWPEAAKSYALNDATHAYNVMLAALRSPKIYSVELLDKWHTVWPDSIEQTRYDWALHLIGCWGIRTDGERVGKLDKYLTGEMKVLDKMLFEGGYLKKKGAGFSKDMKKIKQRVTELYDGLPPRKDPTVKMLEKGIDIGNIKTDSKETLAAIAHLDPMIKALCDREPLSKELSSFMPVLKQGLDQPVNPGWNVLVNSGRTSCRKPNLQQLPRRPGVRQCFTTRKGNVWIGADYSFAELCGIAQVQYEWFGDNALRDVINANKYDPHVMMAANIAGISPDEGQRRHKAKDKRFKEMRTLSKACFHPDTEVLTRKGWKRIALLDESEEVMSAQPDDKTKGVRLLWERPLRLTERDCPDGELVHLKNEGMDLRVTPDHRMLGFSQNGNHKVVMPEELNKCRAWKNAGIFEEGDWAPDERVLRLAVAAQADGNYNGLCVRFGFTKQRKIDRLLALAEDDCSVSIHTNGKNPDVTSIKLTPELSSKVKALLDVDKRLHWGWLSLTARLRGIAVDETVHWDGSKAANWVHHSYSSTDLQSIDVMQALATMSGRKTRCAHYDSKRSNRLRSYRLSIKKGAHTRGGALSTARIPYTGKVVCLSVPSTFIVARDGGVPVVVGQCNFGYPGGLGAKTFIDFAKASYGVEITHDKAVDLKRDWLTTYPEMGMYLDRIGGMLGPGAVIQQTWSGRVRGGLSYCSAANGFMQGIVADGAKIGLYLVVRACYNEPDSPLYGVRTNAFIHDEILAECPPEQCHDAATELSRLMLVGIRTPIPDVLVKAEPYASTVFSKEATDETFYNEHGRIIPWTRAEADRRKATRA